MVVELSLRRPAHGTVSDAADNMSAQPAASALGFAADPHRPT